MNISRTVFSALAALMSLTLAAGTVVYRPNKEAELRRVSNVKIISIEKGIMTLEVDGGSERIPLSKVEGYYDTDLKSSSDGFDDNTPEYAVTITKIDAPERPQKKIGGKLTKETFNIEYRINPTYTKEQTQGSVKYPYFYLYIMTENDGSGERPIYLSYYPKLANPSKKTYDKAAIMDKVLSSKRVNLYGDRGGSFGSISSWDRKVELPLTMIRSKNNPKIIAWHLEIWGKTDVICEKDWKDPGSRVGNNWWQRL